MAKLEQILARRWAGMQYTIQNADAPTLQLQYDSLIWLEASPAKPTFAEVQAQEASVDLELAAEAAQERQQDALMDDLGRDNLLWAFETLANAVFEIGAKLKAASLTSPLDATVQARLVNLRNKIATARTR